ncbi:2-hydroxychromene-2-carboxylate isomerase [uncultured Limimaricola sp.]|uniref:2-hydroxychromene-2-carboxylate isomerase n=1 Tax=uncultured Limimaricola sp. TaxID=2211667 RepID=UPI0030FB26E2
MPKIDYFFATLSPYVYIAGRRLEEIAAKHGAEIAYRPMDVMALFPRSGGQLPKDRHPSRLEYRAQEMRRQAKKAGLPLVMRPANWPTNGAPSSYAIINAQKAGGGDMGTLVHAITRACWAEEKDIALEEVIRDALEEAGFDPGLAESNLMMAADQYGQNLEEAVRRGVFGSPFYITDTDERFWGQDRLGDLDLHLSGQL